MKLAVFDFDSTLMNGETIDFLARTAGVEEEVAKLTKDAMEGKLDFFESLTKRVRLLKGLEYEKVLQICQDLPLMKGAKETINELKKHDYKIACFSGGFSEATSSAKEILGLDIDFSNTLHQENGKLTGLVGGSMMFSNSKAIMLKKLQSLLGIDKENTLVVGDGANDLCMFEYAKIKVAFCAKDILRKEANIIIKEQDLSQILAKI